MSLGRTNGRVVVLGGGISGLAAAWRLSSRIDPSRVVLLEGQNTVGGWIHTERTTNGGLFELGPRSIRPQGKAGMATLGLVSELGLEGDVLPVTASHPYVKRRYICSRNQLHALPTSPSLPVFLRTHVPFEKPFIRAVLKDLISFRGAGVRLAHTPPDAIYDLAEDESVHSFFARRFGHDIATFGAGALTRGVFAGDAKMLSLRSCFPLLHDLEKKHRSIVLGMLRNKADPVPAAAAPLVHQSRKDRWRMWTLGDGLEQLPQVLYEKLLERGVDVRLGSMCEEVGMTGKGVQVRSSDGQEIDGDHVISALPAQQLSSALSPQFPYIKEQLADVVSATVAIVQMEFDGDVIPEQYKGFGYLVPPVECDWVLGVVLDSCSFPEHNSPGKPNSTRLTVMLGGQWFHQQYKDVSDSDKQFVQHALKALRLHLDIVNPQPSYVKTTVLKDSIPQYYTGHHTRLEGIDAYIRQRQLPISLVGASYRGVSVNDCVHGAFTAVDSLLSAESDTDQS